MDVFIKGFVALFDLLKFFPRTFKLLKKNLINARKLLENMWVKAEGTDLYFHKIFQIWTFL